MSGKPVFDGEFVYVMASRCKTCIFRPGNKMHLQEGRVEQMVRDAKAGDSVIPCHSTTYGQHEQEAICRGYWERHADEVWTLRLAREMGIIREIEVEVA